MKKIILTLLALMALAFTASALESINVVAGPWTTNVTETGFNVVWVTSYDCITFVEIAPGNDEAFNASERPRYYQTIAGRAYSGRFHNVRIDGLKPGTKYRYRMFMQSIATSENPYAIVYGETFRSTNPYWEDFETHTLDYSASSCRFSVVNDMHDQKEKFAGLFEGKKASDLDFVLLNGDIVSYSGDIDTVADHTFNPIKNLLYYSPVFYARGNHESRGKDFDKVGLLTPSPSGQYYYVFRQGPAAFIVLDASEDKPDNSPEYSGYAHFDAYREAELKWIQKAVEDPVFKSAPVKIAVMHIPPRDEASSWHTDKWLVKNFVPVLNKAGVDVMLSAHKHKHSWYDKGACGNEFPIIVNSHIDRLDVEASSTGVKMRVFNAKGKEIHSYEVTE